MKITGAGLVGIGVETPTSILDVRTTASTTGSILNLSNTTGAATGNIVPIRFYTGNTFGGLEQVAAIWGINPNAATNNGGSLVFAVSANGTATTPTERMRITNGGLVNINDTTNTTYQLYVSGTIYATGDITASSDARYKTNIRPIENALAKIVSSRGVIYDRINEESYNNIGFIAQELEVYFPELVSTDNEGFKGVKYQNAVAVLFEAIKEQQKQIEELKILIDGFTK